MNGPYFLSTCPNCAGTLAPDIDELVCLNCGIRFYPGVNPSIQVGALRHKRNPKGRSS